MWENLLTALALVLVVEGILPFLNPAQFRKSLLMISQMNDGNLRAAGLVFMFIGVALLYLVRS